MTTATIQLNHRDEIVLDGVPTGYVVMRNVATKVVQRVVKCSTNRDLALPRDHYPLINADFERDFRAAVQA